jgi:hypothetical protein
MQTGVACSARFPPDGGSSFVGVAVFGVPQAETSKTMINESKRFFIIQPSEVYIFSQYSTA